MNGADREVVIDQGIMDVDAELELGSDGEDGDLVNEVVLDDIYLVKNHAFQWKVDEKLKREKQYQTDITLCINNTHGVRLPQGKGSRKPRMLQTLEKKLNLTFPLSTKWSAAMSLQRSFWDKYSDYCISFKVNTSDVFFKQLQRIVFDATLVVELKIDDLTGKIEIRLDDDDVAVVEVFRRDFARLINKKLHNGKNIDGTFSVQLKGKENMYSKDYKGFNLAQKLYEEKPEADCTLVVANGAEIECHQLILKLHSPVFRSMFESGLTETVTRKVKIEDMTEEAMKALLKFLYLGDLEQPVRSLSIASRLLQHGHRYEIKELEQAMMQLFGAKRSPDVYKKWFDNTSVEETLDLYEFAHNVGSGYENVEKACVNMLKIRTDELEKSQQFMEMFRTKQELPKQQQNEQIELAVKLSLALAKQTGK